MRFIDTNVLIYAVSTQPEDQPKAARAEVLLKSRDLALSVQVLQEFYVQATRPTRAGALLHDEAVRFAMSLRRFHVQELNLAVFADALRFRELFQLSYWDCAILAAARTCGCSVVLSEDMSDGQDYEGVRVVNPFSKGALGRH